MWYPLTLKISNLFSHQDSLITFSKGKMTCIYGSNQTDPKTLSNGSGKTSLLDCVAIALTGSPLRQISKKEIVRNGHSFGLLELTLRNDVSSSNLIIREIVDRVKSNKVELYENSQLNAQLKDMAPKDAHKHVLQLIGVSEDDLLNYYLLGKDTYQSFFTTKDSVKKEVINRFSRANIIDPIDAFIKTDISRVDTEVIEIDKKIVYKQSRIEVLKEQIEQLSSVDKEKEKQDRVNELNAKIIECADYIESLEVNITQWEGQKIKLQEELTLRKNQNTLDKQFTAINNKLLEVNNKLTSIRKEYNDIDVTYANKIESVNLRIDKEEIDLATCKHEQGKIIDMINEIERHLADEIECPKCHYKFCFQDREYDIEKAKTILLPQLQEQIVNKKAYITAHLEVIKSFEKNRDEILKDKAVDQVELLKLINTAKEQLSLITKEEDELKSKERELKAVLTKLEDNIASTDRHIKNATEEIKSVNSTIERYLKAIDNIGNEKAEDVITSIEAQITALNQEVTDIHGDRESRSAHKESLETWRQRFKKFKSHLANNSISAIESLTNHYLQAMRTHLSVSVDGFREKADGTLREEITTEVSRDGGVTLESFQKFSGGERAKIDVAGILAMQRLINLNAQSGGLDLLWIDEIIDAIDRVALTELVQSLSAVNQTILLISHIDLPEMEHSIKVEKRLGVSHIINN